MKNTRIVVLEQGVVESPFRIPMRRSEGPMGPENLERYVARDQVVRALAPNGRQPPPRGGSTPSMPCDPEYNARTGKYGLPPGCREEQPSCSLKTRVHSLYSPDNAKWGALNLNRI